MTYRKIYVFLQVLRGQKVFFCSRKSFFCWKFTQHLDFVESSLLEDEKAFEEIFKVRRCHGYEMFPFKNNVDAVLSALLSIASIDTIFF